MNPPASVIIGPFRYTVERSVQARRDLVSEDCQGDSSHDQLHIRVRDDLADDMTVETVLHEVFHGLMHASGLKYDLSDKLEERIVTRLSPVLLDVIRRNPKLVAYLAAK